MLIKWLHSAGSSLSQANSSKTSQSSLTSSGFLYYEDPHRYNGSDISANASETTTTSTAKSVIHLATPYSDKYYQPIISQGAKGFDKLIIPVGFRADNQTVSLEEDKEAPIQQDQLQEIANSLMRLLMYLLDMGQEFYLKMDMIKINQRQIILLMIQSNWILCFSKRLWEISSGKLETKPRSLFD